MESATLVFYNNQAKEMGRDVTKKDGRCIPAFKAIDSVTVSMAGYLPCTFKYKPDCRLSVNMVDGIILQKNAAVLKIQKRTNTVLKVVSLSTNYSIENPSEVDLKKLEESVPVYFYAARRYYKE
jgi:hypothetical protein